MPTATAEKCSCGMPLGQRGCIHCDTGTCPFCIGFNYSLCERNAEYNARTTDRLGIHLFPLIGGMQIAV